MDHLPQEQVHLVINKNKQKTPRGVFCFPLLSCYHENMKKRFRSWQELRDFVVYYFSISRLLRSLFVPWHRDQFKSEDGGIWGIIENLSFALFTRALGFFIRLITILVGIIAIFIVYLSLPIILLLPIQFNYSKLSRLGSIGKTWSYPITYFLDAHGRDLRLLPDVLVIDHDNGLKQVERALSRDHQQNVLIVGPQGVGKTTRLSYLAKKMYRDLSTPKLNSKRLVELFPEEMTKEELHRCFHEAVSAGNIVLVIENIERFHILDVIESYLDVPHFQIILTTDNEHFNETFKYNAHLMRAVDVVEFFPPDEKVTMLYLIDRVERMGIHHRFPDETLASIVILSEKFILNDYQPEKSFDLLDELVLLEKDIVRPEDVEELISEKLRIPLGVLQQDERDKLLNLEKILNTYVIGQEEATHAIVSSLKRSRLGVGSEKRPIGSFLFIGTTGVGKTHTAKILAQYYFGSRDFFHRFDMSEYRELSSIERFMERLGAEVEDMPYSLILFDELEKAHPDILNVLLQVLDEGIMHTPKGRAINLRNTIIIATSNAGARYLLENGHVSKELLVQHIISEGILRPELINRFDDVILFRTLDREEVKKVAILLLHELNVMLAKRHGIQVSIDPELVDALARKGHSLKFGLRPLRRLIQDKVETYVADLLLRDELPETGIIHIDSSIISQGEKKIPEHLKYV